MRYDDDIDLDRLDVWSFRAAERLRVHEARTDAENASGVIRHAETVVARGRSVVVSEGPDLPRPATR